MLRVFVQPGGSPFEAPFQRSREQSGYGVAHQMVRATVTGAVSRNLFSPPTVPRAGFQKICQSFLMEWPSLAASSTGHGYPLGKRTLWMSKYPSVRGLSAPCAKRRRSCDLSCNGLVRIQSRLCLHTHNSSWHGIPAEWLSLFVKDPDGEYCSG